MDKRAKEKLQLIISLGIIIFITLCLVGHTVISTVTQFNNSDATTSKAVQSASSINPHQILNHPTPSQMANIQDNIEPILGSNLTDNHHGAFIVNSNQPTIKSDPTTKPTATNTLDHQHRPDTANAFLTKPVHSLTHTPAAHNGLFNNQYIPSGWHQMKGLPGKYASAYQYGYLLSPALTEQVKGFDTSTNNKKNVITQTSWAHSANNINNTGQQYYEGLVQQALNNHKKVQYQVTPIYGRDNHNAVCYGTHLQAISTDGSLKFNVFIPNAQGNIDIDYQTGKVTQHTDKY